MNFNPFDLQDKVIVVTGASSGIGAQCAIDCSKMGARVVLVARSEERLRSTLQKCENPQNHLIVPMDLTSSVAIRDCIKSIVSKMGEISGVLNCVGISSVTPLKWVNDEMMDDFFRTNVYSSINFTKEVARVGNFDRNGCSIVLFSSIMGICGEKGKVLYGATKGALISAAKSIACELSRLNIRVNVVCPGAIETPINADQPYMKNPELRKRLEEKHLLGIGRCSDISNACIYLLSNASRWVTGQNIIIDGGYSVL